MTREQRAMCRIQWRFVGLTQRKVAALMGTNITQIQLAIHNTAGDGCESDWEYVPSELRAKYEGKVGASESVEMDVPDD